MLLFLFQRLNLLSAPIFVWNTFGSFRFARLVDFFNILLAKSQVATRKSSPTHDIALIRTAPLLLHDDRRADLDPVIEIDHVLIGQANAAR
jgi:hypothetical protein